LIKETTKENIFNPGSDKFKIHAYEVFLGDCIGNSNGYQGRENWILIEHKEDTLETMAVKKLSRVYNKGKEELNSIISKSNNDIIKLIKIKSNLLEKRQEIEETENKLDNINKKINEFNFEEEIRKSNSEGNGSDDNNSNFPNHGLLLEIFNIDKSSKNHLSLVKKMFISQPLVKDNKIEVLNFINEFNLETGISHEEVLEELTTNKNSLIKLSGLLIINEDEEFQLRVETNSK